MQYDVIIIGSGPSGSSTALHLAQRSPELARRTLILERDRHPRHKLCGGGCVND
ncbi:MAG: FAD-dependent oxidoreductase, partial [Maioricimonas sp. JB049]